MQAEIDVNTLQQEALRLLSQQIRLIEDMTNVKNLVVAKDRRETQSFTQESAREDVEVLGDEVKKLEGLVFVVAVVGTMKAGKSTAINAIVGTEVLPARNRPMTAVPTLIRHKPGTIRPVLRFENHRPVDDLVERLRAALKGRSMRTRMRSRGELANEINSDPHFKDLVNFVERGDALKTRYEGASEIAEFLKDLNDLVRLSKELDIDFPFDSYDSVEEMPVIEVEFAHIDVPDREGELCLLDTPGPNESGQPHLHKILREQLTKASAVVAVLDYSQIGSQADAEVRGEIDNIAPAMDNRAYALVNKFDEHDRHGDDEEQLKYRVSEGLLKGSVSADRVFPVSAKWAYLANRAKHEFRSTGRLPDAADAPWIEDFGEEALGRRWEKDIKDIPEVLASAEELWKDSLFGEFLDHVIRAAHEDAATLAVESASGKLRVYGERISNCLSVRGNALKTDANSVISDLNAQIRALEADTARIGSSEKKARAEVGELFKSVEHELCDLGRRVTAELEETIECFFTEGRKVEKAEFEKALEEDEDKPRLSILDALRRSFFPQSEEASRPERVFDPNTKRIEFKSEDKARHLIEKLSNSVQEIKNAYERALRGGVKDAIKGYDTRINNILNRPTREVTVDLNERLGADYGVYVKMPEAQKLKVSDWALDSLDDSMREQTYIVTRLRRQRGVWGKICDWFDTDDWGWEEYSKEKTKFVIEVEKIRHTVEDNMRRFTDEAIKDVSRDITGPLDENIKRSCGELKDKVQRLCGDFKQSVQDRKLKKEPQQVLINEIDRILDISKGIEYDLDGLGKAIEARLDSRSEQKSRTAA